MGITLNSSTSTAVTFYRLRAGSYVTDLLERPGSWAIYAYEGPTKGGWVVAQFEADGELSSRGFYPTLRAARDFVTHTIKVTL